MSAFAITLAHPPKALLSMVGTDEGSGWVGNSDRGSDLKGAGYGIFSETLRTWFFPAAADLESALLNRAAPLDAVVLLVAGVELHPHGWVYSTLGALVDL
jgi:hypothetical protein